MNQTSKSRQADNMGYFGRFGGQYIDSAMKAEFDKIYAEFLCLKEDTSFNTELSENNTRNVT